MTTSFTDLQFSAQSLQYVKVPVATDDGTDPTGFTVSMSFPGINGEPTTFYNASWETINGLFYARCLVGPGGATQLSDGFYDVYVKILALSESPVLFAGRIEVT